MKEFTVYGVGTPMTVIARSREHAELICDAAGYQRSMISIVEVR